MALPSTDPSNLRPRKSPHTPSGPRIPSSSHEIWIRFRFEWRAVLESTNTDDGNEETRCNLGESWGSWDKILFRANKVDIENYSVDLCLPLERDLCPLKHSFSLLVVLGGCCLDDLIPVSWVKSCRGVVLEVY